MEWVSDSDRAPNRGTKRERGVGPPKGKNQGERQELSQTHSRSEGHSKRAGSRRAPRQSPGRGRSPTRRREHQAQKTTCGQQEVQGGQGSVPTGRVDQRRDPRTPEDPQPHLGPPGKEAPAAAGH